MPGRRRVHELAGIDLPRALMDDGRVAAILDWEQAVLGPREHDVWMAAEGDHGDLFMAKYNARDPPGVETWGFRRIAKLERDLEMFRPFCA